MSKYIIILFTLTALAFAQDKNIEYFKVVEGKAVNIDEKEFDSCRNIIYRRSAVSKLLPLEHKKKLLKAIIKGKTINNLTVVFKRDEHCSYKGAQETYPE